MTNLQCRSLKGDLEEKNTPLSLLNKQVNGVQEHHQVEVKKLSNLNCLTVKYECDANYTSDDL